MQPVLDLDLLRTFSAVVEQGGFKSAADKLGRTPSSVSMQIKRLEDQLQRRVLERNNQGIALTETGRVLVRYSDQFLRLNDAAVSSLLKEELVGDVHFGIPADYVPRFVGRFLPVLRRHFPSLRPRVTSEPSRVLRRMVRSKEIDVAFLSQEPGTQEGELLWTESLAWMKADAVQAPVDEKLPVALLSADCVLRDLALSCLKASQIPYEVIVSSSSIAAVVAGVEAGLGVALLPESSLAAETRLSRLRESKLRCHEPLRVSMVWSTATKEQRAESILNLVRTILRS